jgi:hypothetical protein
MVFSVGVEEESHRWYEVVGVEAVGSKNKGDSLSFTVFVVGPSHMSYIDLFMPNHALVTPLPNATIESGFALNSKYLENTGVGFKYYKYEVSLGKGFFYLYIIYGIYFSKRDFPSLIHEIIIRRWPLLTSTSLLF